MEKYNGMTILQVRNNLPSNMTQGHKELYLKNCKEVIKNQLSGFNLDYNEFLKNSNFRLIVFYTNLTN